MKLLTSRTAAILMALALPAAGCSPGPQKAAADAAPKAPVQTGTASYYGAEFAGETTASGETMKPHEMTAASRTLPLGAEAKVTNMETGKSVTVEVNDRGPYAKGRILDVTPKAAERLGFKDDGTAKVAVQPLPDRDP